MDAGIESRLNEIQDTVDHCCEVGGDGACYHCRQKQDLINLACAWAFDLGASLTSSGLAFVQKSVGVGLFS